ncbi:CIC11C00000002221 [Sungouiella intermedia]|uniref:CIC11C00000002221 n=1 Tax=Sungouiella intermedia TaxID=45354 RepID=A0A1L0BKR8_9ASCO|nr:CIC11C00000002221 [[Candida] intermedia]
MWLKRFRHLVGSFLYDNTVEEEYYKKMRQKSSSNSAFIVGMVAAVGGFLYGYDTGLINDIMEMNYVKSHIPGNKEGFTVHERALITAILLLGTFIGALIAPLLSDTYGRKFSIILSSAIIFNLGNALQVLATEVKLLGHHMGTSNSAGRLSGDAKDTVDCLLSYPYWSPIFVGRDVMPWYALLPESPRYYVQKNNIQAALRSLSKLRRLPDDDADLIEELVEIKANYDYEMSFGKTTILDCFRLGGGRHKQKLRITTGMGVHAFQQCSGINFIFYYGVNFFASTGIQNYYLMSFITYLVNVLFTIPGIILIDIVGRRQLLLYGGVGMSVCNFTIAIIGVTVGNQESKSIVSIVFSCCFIACFASTWGGCVWALASDIYGISIRQKAVAITASSNWLVNFTFAYITPYLIDTGLHTAALGNKIFFIWGGCNALGTVFVYFMVYETKGLKLEEVDFMYLNCENSRASTKFKSRTIDYSNMPTGPCDQSLVGTPPNHEWASRNLNDKEILNSSSSPGAHDDHNAPSVHGSDTDLEPDVSDEQLGPRVTMVPHNNILAPSLSNTSSESSENSLMSTHSATDYQKYLQSLQKETTLTTKRHPLTSQTSNSILRIPGASNKYTGTQSASIMRLNSSQSHTGTSLTNTDSFASANLPENMSLGLQLNGNMKIIAAPFFNNPPSDSDSD